MAPPPLPPREVEEEEVCACVPARLPMPARLSAPPPRPVPACVRVCMLLSFDRLFSCFRIDLEVWDRKNVIQQTIKGKKERIRDIKEKGLLFRMERKVWENSLIIQHTIEGGKKYILGIK